MTQLAWIALFGSIGLAALLAPLWIHLLRANNIAMPQLRGRDVHRERTPRLGGLLIAAVFWLVVGVIVVVSPDALRFSDARVLGIDRSLLGVLLGSLVLVVVGVVDDIRAVGPWPKLAWQTVAAMMLPAFGVRIDVLTNPFGGPAVELAPVIDALIIIAWIVLVINAMNFLDGLDGLATSIASIALTILIVLSLAPFVNQPILALLLIPLFGSCLGFLTVNWHPAKLFLGDSGSQLLGFMLAVAAIMSGGKLATAGLVLGFPILDALWAIVRRIWAGRSPFSADREHLHHRLLDLGLPQPLVVLVLMFIATVFGIIALTSQTGGKVHALIALPILLVILLAGISLLEQRLVNQKRSSNGGTSNDE